MIQKADATARMASSIMTIAVGFTSLAVAMLIAVKFFVPQVDSWIEHKEVFLGLVIVLIIAASYLIPIKLLKTNP